MIRRAVSAAVFRPRPLLCRGPSSSPAAVSTIRPVPAVGTAAAFATGGPRAHSTAAHELLCLQEVRRPLCDVRAEASGELNDFSWRLHFRDASKNMVISPWHQIPLHGEQEGTFHFVNEIPRGTTEKMEIATNEPGNPIKQDVKKGKLRVITHGPVLHNYGCLPQTWEDPGHMEEQRYPGDNDPLDVIEVGEAVLERGAVVAVKVLGVLGLVDEGECDWKLICINVADPKASQYSDIDDLPAHVVDNVREWYRVYKMVDGKPANDYLFDGAAKDKEFAERVVEECHRHWNELPIPRTEPRIEREQK